MRRWLASFALLFASSAAGSSFIDSPIEETLAETPVVVRGVIGKSEVRQVKLKESTFPFTFWDLRVTEVLKGGVKPSAIQIRQLGGEREGAGMVVSGAADFSAGEEVVLMLDAPSAGDAAYPIRGLATGKYAIEKDAEGTEYIIGAGIRSEPHGPPRLALKEVRRILATQKKSPPPSPTDSATTGLLGDRATSPAAGVESPAPSPAVEESSDEPPRFSLSRLWILVLGAAIGFGFYARSRRR